LIYSIDLEDFEEILLENLSKIYSSSNFTFHSNFVLPFHSNFWKGIFLLKSQRNWNLYIFHREMLSNQQFDLEIFSTLLTECEFRSIEINKTQYQRLLDSFAKICLENSKNQELSNEIMKEWAFDDDLADFIEENKYHFTRYREFLLKLCFSPSILSLISPEIFENIITSHSDETIFADFVNLLLQKSLLLNAPSLLPSYILKHKRFGKYLTIESLGLLYYYLTDRKLDGEYENGKTKTREEFFMKINTIHEWKVKTFTEMNLQNNLNLCSLSCKNNIRKFLMRYWQNFKLKAPLEFYNNKYFFLKDALQLKNIEEQEFRSYDDSILFNFYKTTQTAFKSVHLDTLDDYYGELIIKVVQSMPVIRKIDLSGLNLGDHFCQIYSDFLIIRKIKRITSNLAINLSNNKRITNVGLKFLYVSFELAYSKQDLNPTHKPKNFMAFFENSPAMSSTILTEKENGVITGPTIEIDSDIRASSSTTFILDNGLGSFILLKIKEFFWAKKKYCFNCDKEVCNRCHKDWSTHEGVENLNCKKPKTKQINMENTVILECFRKEYEKQVKESKKWTNKIKLFLYYAMILPFLLDNVNKALIPAVKISIIYLKKSENSFQKWFAKLGQKKTDKTKLDITKQNQMRQKIYNFVMGYDEDPKQKEVTKFKFNYNVNVLNEIFGRKRIAAFYYVNLLIYYLISVLTPIWFSYYSNVFFGVYALVTFLIETVFILKIIKIINAKTNDSNKKKQKNLIHNFSLKYYLPLLFFSQSEKYDFFTDIQFIIHLYQQDKELEKHLAHASLIVLSLIIVFNTIQLMFVTYDSFISSKEKMGIANANINKFSMISFLTHFKGIGFCLDLFSTKNAVKIGSNYVPQVMVSSVSKCVLENIPQFIVQMIYLANSEINDIILITMISTIFSFVGAIKTALLAKGSMLTKKNLKEKFSTENFFVGKYKKNETLESESRNEEIPLENVPVKFDEKYTTNYNDSTSPFNNMMKIDETGRELILSNK